MGLDNANWIGDLDPTLPLPADPIAEGDNQIRDMKAALQASFPNVKGQVTATHDQLNAVTGDVSNLYPHLVPQGTIIMWSGTDAATPAGWSLCDGQSVNGVVTPDLRSKFILGSTGDGGGDQTGKTGLSPNDATITSTSVGNHSHSGNTGYSVTPLPQHQHFVAFSGIGNDTSPNLGSSDALRAGNNSGDNNKYILDGNLASSNPADVGLTSEAGTTSTNHRHTISGDGGHSHTTTVNFPRPAFYALAYIMKTSTNPVAA